QPYRHTGSGNFGNAVAPDFPGLLEVGDQFHFDAALMRRDQRFCNARMGKGKRLHQYLFSCAPDGFDDLSCGIMPRPEENLDTRRIDGGIRFWRLQGKGMRRGDQPENNSQTGDCALQKSGPDHEAGILSCRPIAPEESARHANKKRQLPLPFCADSDPNYWKSTQALVSVFQMP